MLLLLQPRTTFNNRRAAVSKSNYRIYLSFTALESLWSCCGGLGFSHSNWYRRIILLNNWITTIRPNGLKSRQRHYGPVTVVLCTSESIGVLSESPPQKYTRAKQTRDVKVWFVIINVIGLISSLKLYWTRVWLVCEFNRMNQLDCPVSEEGIFSIWRNVFGILFGMFEGIFVFIFMLRKLSNNLKFNSFELFLLPPKSPTRSTNLWVQYWLVNGRMGRWIVG